MQLISEKLQEVIDTSWFTVEDGAYVYARVQQVVHPEKHLAIINDLTELTIVTLEENLPLLNEYDSNKERWKLINIRCGKPFYCVGFIAAITGALADAGIDIVLMSSFSNDLVLVMEKNLSQSMAIIQGLGFSHRQ